uniref:Coiled-coil domain-containing protein 168 isoform X3 n=1 Tax=Phascolarctos cinereus TaxID=38626 RepID=A0A6P5JA98_PHACI|nr:coiled-coil domain-containing protein 168 isoform X3 [Phascolarctos cinereus]
MEKEAAAMLRDYLESWVSVSDWKAVFIMTFLAVVFELLLLELCKTCHKKISERKVQKESCSDSSEEEENSFLKNLEYENWPHAELPPKRRKATGSQSSCWTLTTWAFKQQEEWDWKNH